MSLTRREFVRNTTAFSTLAAVAPRLAFSADGASARGTLVVVFLRGGMDGLNVVVPHGDADYYRLRPSIGIALGRAPPMVRSISPRLGAFQANHAAAAIRYGWPSRGSASPTMPIRAEPACGVAFDVIYSHRYPRCILPAPTLTSTEPT